MNSDSAIQPALRALVERWRERARRDATDAFESATNYGIRHRYDAADIERAVNRCADELAALLAAPAEPREGWQPMETAPKDGTFILACHIGPWQAAYEQWRAPMTVCWRAFHPNAPGKPQWRDATGKPVDPTHWQPLPAPPKDRS